jgi:very-short-patch-repair endonuclease
LVRRQRGVVSRRQLLELGFSRRAIEHRLVTGRLHPIRPGVYAVGRREITREAEWMAAVLGCGRAAALSHESGAAALGIRPDRGGVIEVSVPANLRPRQPGVRVHRRASFGRADLALVRNIPVTGPACTLIDLAARLGTDQLEAAINEADKLDLIDPETLRDSLSDVAPRPGLAVLRRTLDAQTFTLTDTELERRFLQIVREVGLSEPLTQQWVNGFRVDFYWPDLGLVVETDGLRYHRTPAAQARDRLRDQAHTAAGLTPLRFTRAQVRFQQAYVRRILADVAGRLG